MIDLEKIRAIDPPGCGCTECIIGEYIPYDDPYIDEVLEAILDGRMNRPKNNLSDGSLVIYRSMGKVTSDIHPFTNRADMVFVPVNLYRYGRDSTVEVSTIQDRPEDEQQALIEAALDDSVDVENRSGDGYILYRSPYGETGVVELYGCSGEPTILLYEE